MSMNTENHAELPTVDLRDQLAAALDFRALMMANAELRESNAELAAALDVMMDWAREVSDEKIDGEGTREQYVDDLKQARAAIAKAKSA